MPSSVTSPMCAACRSHFSKICSTSASRPFLTHEQHALLRFGQHDLVRRHAGLALRHVHDVDLDAGAAARAHLAGRAGQPGGAHVLHADERVGLHQLEARLEQQLLHERIADLHRRPLLGRLVVELRRRHRRAVDAVAAGLRRRRSRRDCRCRDALPLTSASARRDAEAEHVDQRVAGVAVVERNLAADGRDADAVAVAGDAGDDAFDDAARARAVGPSSRPKRSEFSSAIGRAPIVKMSRMMPPTPVAAPWYGSMNDGWLCDSILKTAASPSPMSTAPAFSPGPCSDARARGRQLLQVDARALVAAVLGPHHREDPELGQGRLAAERRGRCAAYSSGLRPWRSSDASASNALMTSIAVAARPGRPSCVDDRFEQHQAVGAAERRLAGALGMRHQADDVARLVADAGDVVRREPFGFAASVDLAVRVAVAEDDPAGRFELARARRARRSSCLRRARSACAAPGPAARAVNGVSVCSTRTCTCSQWNFRSRLRSIAPGSRPASSRI